MKKNDQLLLFIYVWMIPYSKMLPTLLRRRKLVGSWKNPSKALTKWRR